MPITNWGIFNLQSTLKMYAAGVKHSGYQGGYADGGRKCGYIVRSNRIFEEKMLCGEARSNACAVDLCCRRQWG